MIAIKLVSGRLMVSEKKFSVDVDLSSAKEVIEELRTATREAREALADVNRMRREWVEMKREWETTVPTLFDKQFAEAIKKGFGTLDHGIKAATEAVYRRFDTLAAIMMGEDSGEPLVDAARKKARRVPFTAKQRQAAEQWRKDLREEIDGD